MVSVDISLPNLVMIPPHHISPLIMLYKVIIKMHVTYYS